MINLRRINLNLLTFFEALYQEKNLTAAAKRISVSQPAMSHALSRLRATFNDELFVRTTHGMEPTPRAHRLAPLILAALDSVRQGLQDATEFDPSIPRTFNLGGIDHVDLVAVPELVRRNAAKLSRIHFCSLAVREDEYEDLLKSNQVDLIIDVAAPVSPELRLEPIAHRRLVPALRAGHPLAGEKLERERLLELQFAVLATQEDTCMEPLETYLKEHGCIENIAVRVHNISSLYEIVRHSDLVGFAPEPAADEHSAGIVALDVDMPPIDITHYMIWHEFQTDDPGHRWLRDEVRAIYESTALPDTAQ